MSRAVHAAKALYSMVRLVRDPNRLGEVFSLSDSLMAAAPPERFDEVIGPARRLPGGKRAFADKPRIGAIDLAALAKLPDGTLGKVFATHMIEQKLDPSALPSMLARTDIEFFRAHLYETHDVWHAVTGFATDVPGELGLQAFYMAQIPGGLPAAILAAGFMNTLVYAMDQRDARMRQIVRGWLLGKRAKPFFGVRWADLWAVPLEEVRRRLDVDIEGVEAVLPDVAPRLAEAA